MFLKDHSGFELRETIVLGSLCTNSGTHNPESTRLIIEIEVTGVQLNQKHT